MKISILTYGSQGDVAPFIALSHGFARRGHRVTLAAPGSYRSRFELGDINFQAYPGSPAQLVKSLVDGAGTNRFRMVRRVSNFVLPLADQVFQGSRMACRDADVILHSFLLTSTGIGLGEASGIPTISAQLFPVFSNTNAFPAPVFPDLPLGGGYRTLTHKLVSNTFRWGSRILYRWARKNNPDLPNLTRWTPDEKGHRQIPILYGFSPQVVPKPNDWGPNAHVTGYWHMQDQEDRNPDPELMDFIQSGPPPVAVAFGSTRTRKLGELVHKVMEALALHKQRGVIVAEGVDLSEAPPHILKIAYVPYGWLFTRSAAVVHHGGAGTTALGLMAGVPNIVLPFTSDQPFWGRRVHALGAGPRPIPANRLSVRALTAALDQALNDPHMRAQAQQMGERVRAEDGVARAVHIVENYVTP